MGRLIGETILVTGAAQGVGAAVARRLVKDGATRATLIDRQAVGLEATAAALRAEGCAVHTIAVDLTDAEACGRAVAEAESAFGPVEILCSCAGATDRGTIFDTSVATFDLLFATNVRAPFFILQAALPAMVARKSGVIISMSSMLAYGGTPYLVAYSASKAALNTMTRGVANAVKADRVRLHAINLGWTVTPGEHRVQTQVHGQPDDWAEREGAKQSFGRLLDGDDPAALCAFLASTEAVMMTGTVIDLEQWVIGTLDVR